MEYVVGRDPKLRTLLEGIEFFNTGFVSSSWYWSRRGLAGSSTVDVLKSRLASSTIIFDADIDTDADENVILLGS